MKCFAGNLSLRGHPAGQCIKGAQQADGEGGALPHAGLGRDITGVNHLNPTIHV